MNVTSNIKASKGGDIFQPVRVDSLKVQAEGTKGRTAYREIEISAGYDNVFIPESIVFVEESRSGGGRIRHTFQEHKFKYKSVQFTVEGRVYTIDMPYLIVISLHAETGSGPGNYNRGAWLNGWVKAETIEIDR